uniref:Putative zinc metalloproteinase n=1 Tax=Amblyomma aureolatum TaxID=187763 RepID=A0A1E1XGV2_9ACAR
MACSVTNHRANSVVHYPLALLCGVWDIGDNPASVSVANLSSEFPDDFTSWPVVSGRFKVFVQLVHGRNDLLLKHGTAVESFSLFFEPVLCCQRCYIRLVYVTCCDAPQQGHFQGPENEDCSIESACSRIGLGMLILQTALAETLAASGIGHKSFCLEHTEKNSSPVVHVFKSKLHYDKARGMTGEDIWSHVATELMNSELRDGDRCKFVAFLSWTRYQADVVEAMTHSEVLSRMSGHVMVGAGGLALCGTGCLYTWAQNVEELPRRLYDTRQVDRLRFMDDSNYRGTLSACYSSSLGGVLHEMGHTFGLGHTREGIMGHGFHDISYVYTVSNYDAETVWDSFSSPVQSSVNVESIAESGAEPRRIRLTTLKPKGQPGSMAGQKHCTSPSGAKWSRSCAVILSHHPWMNDKRRSSIVGCIQLRGEHLLTSPHGICLVEFRRPEDAMVIGFWEFSEGAEEVCIEPKKLHLLHLPESEGSLELEQHSKKNTGALHIFAVDMAGNTFAKIVDFLQSEAE